MDSYNLLRANLLRKLAATVLLKEALFVSWCYHVSRISLVIEDSIVHSNYKKLVPLVPQHY